MTIAVHTAHLEEGPSRGVGRVRNAVGRGLQEVELVLGRAVGRAGEEDEELQQDRAGYEDEGQEGEYGAYNREFVSLGQFAHS